MAVRIRLSRVGATKQPSYRFVVTDSRNARDGRSLETLGHYNPRTDPIEINVNEERAKEWMSKGAKPSDTVDRLFRRIGVLPERTDRPTGEVRGPKKADKTTKAAKRAQARAAAEATATEAPATEAPATEAPASPAEEPTAAEPAAEAAEPTEAAEAAEAAEPTEAAATPETAEPTETDEKGA